MSNTQSPKFDRDGAWRRWQMDELATTEHSHTSDGEVPTAHQRKVQAAQKAAEQARKREESERQALHKRIRQQAEKAQIFRRLRMYMPRRTINGDI